MIKATIFKNNNNNKEAKETLEKMFTILPEKFNYLRYGKINDLYLDLHLKKSKKGLHLNFINY